MDNIPMMLALGLLIFVNMLKFLVIFDVILSWAMLVGIKWRPLFLSQIIDPVYKTIKSIIPTSFGPIDFTPIIVIFSLMFLENLLVIIFPGLNAIINSMN